jgi:hypothetical protein
MSLPYVRQTYDYPTHIEDWREDGSVLMVRRGNAVRLGNVALALWRLEPSAREYCTLTLYDNTYDDTGDDPRSIWRMENLKRADAITLLRAWVRGN